jgi:protein TonB
MLGESHPLRRNAVRVLLRSALLTALIYALGPVAVIVGERLQDEVAPRIDLTRRTPIELLPPPPIDPEPGKGVAVPIEALPPNAGVPDPVPDFRADFTSTIPLDEFVEALASQAWAEFDPDRDTLVIEEPAPAAAPSPGEIVPVEVEPALIELPAPVYPEMARLAGVEGTVVLRVFVGPKGRVLDAQVVEGHVMLNEAALASARGAIYRPALQQDHPTGVWVEQRISFRLD